MLETDAPWCEIRPSHAGSGMIKTPVPCRKKEKFEAGLCVKGRQEPCHIVQVQQSSCVYCNPLLKSENVNFDLISVPFFVRGKLTRKLLIPVDRRRVIVATRERFFVRFAMVCYQQCGA